MNSPRCATSSFSSHSHSKTWDSPQGRRTRRSPQPNARPRTLCAFVVKSFFLFLAEFPDVLGGLLSRDLRLALHHDADLLQDLGVSKRSDIADIRRVGNRGEHPAHDFP